VDIVRAFTAEEAVEILAAAARATTWHDAGINANLDVDRAVRDAEILFESDVPELIAHCRDRLFAATRNIAAAVAPKTVLAEIQIVRYHAGGKYVDHRDTPELGATPRALSLVCYLNEDFSGGETTFADPATTISPIAGEVVIFSPVLLHRAEPVTAGTKYIITAWYHTPPSGSSA
jgi:predicted 2-oxoglutarate/Fe(II)-dependent dioxygenase YbiX